MSPWKGGIVGLALLLAGAGSADAAWNNVFQTCCFGCKRAPVASYYAAPAASPCCTPSVSYVQRCFYQPVTTYKQVTYYEPVTTYRTSYYYEPVTTYKYSTYYDPCTGCPQTQVCPQTCYRLRSQCNAVQSYAAKCAMVPQTSYRQVTYYEPRVEQCPPDPCSGMATAPPAGVMTPGATGEPPLGSQFPGAGVRDGSEDRLAPQGVPPTGSSFRQALPRSLAPQPQWPTTQPVVTKPERVTALPGGINGVVLASDVRTPRAGTKVTFVSRAQPDDRRTATADLAGRFQVALAPGSYDVYLTGDDGRGVFHNRYEFTGERKPVTIIAR